MKSYVLSSCNSLQFNHLVGNMLWYEICTPQIPVGIKYSTLKNVGLDLKVQCLELHKWQTPLSISGLSVQLFVQYRSDQPVVVRGYNLPWSPNWYTA